MSPKNGGNTLRLLPVEIWKSIFDYLRWESWATLLSLNLSCCYFHLMVTPYIFKAVHVQFLRYKHLELGVFANCGYNKTINLPLNGMNKQETEQLREATCKLNPLLEQNVGARIFPHVHVLTVSYGPSYSEDVHSESIGRLVANLPNLQTIRWRGIPFPPHLFRDLRCRQTPPELYFEGAPEEIVGNDLLVGAPFIRSLSITYLPITLSPSHAELNDKLGAVILSLPNLERLILKQYGIHTEKISYLRPPFHLPGDSALPNLRTLTISRFHIDSEQAAAWAQCLRHGKLRQLTLEGTAEMCKLMERLQSTDCVTNLDSFTIRLVGDITPRCSSILRTLLRHFSNLQAFMAFGLPTYILDTAVHHQGQHLRQLRFRQSGLSSVPTPVAEKFRGLSSEQIAELATKLPHVERLGLDMHFENSIVSGQPLAHPFPLGRIIRSGEKHVDFFSRNKPCDPLDSIAQFPSLRYLELNTPVYSANHSRPKQGWVQASIAEESFRYVDRIKAGARLESLDILAGPWGQFQQPFKHTANSPKRRMLPFGWIYASWRDTNLPDKVHELYLPGTEECYWNLSADDVYEQTMLAAGLWDSKATTVYGPAIWRNALTDFFY